jgi:hypothetical protein
MLFLFLLQVQFVLQEIPPDHYVSIVALVIEVHPATYALSELVADLRCAVHYEMFSTFLSIVAFLVRQLLLVIGAHSIHFYSHHMELLADIVLP